MMSRDDYFHALETRPACHADLPLEDWALCFAALHTERPNYPSPQHACAALHRALTYSGFYQWVGPVPQPASASPQAR